MNYGEVKELIAIINTSNLMDFELTIDNVSVKMSKQKMTAKSDSGSVSEATAKSPEVLMVSEETEASCIEVDTTIQKGEQVKAPIVGTFFSGPGSGKPDFVKKGDSVKKGDILCILEAMKIMNEIVSPFDGEVAEIYATNEDLVEYGQPLFRIV